MRLRSEKEDGGCSASDRARRASGGTVVFSGTMGYGTLYNVCAWDSQDAVAWARDHLLTRIHNLKPWAST